MENAISGLTVKRLVEEIKEEIEGKYLDKVQQVGKNTFKFKITPGPIDLLVEPGKRINITRYRVRAPEKPSQSAMIMRKQLSNQKIEKLEQLNFDRVVKITFTTGKQLIVELFGRGNIVITDEEGKITYTYNPREMEGREVKKGKKYQPPTLEMIDPFQVKKKRFKEELKKSSDSVMILTKNMGLGGAIAKEIHRKAGLKDKEKLSPEEAEKLYEALKETLDRDTEPVKQSGEIRPFPLKGEVEETYEKINQAIDENYKPKETREKENKAKKKLEKLKKRLEHQKKSIDKFREKIDENKKKGDLIYSNYGKVSKAVELYKKGKDEELEDIGATKEKGKILLDLD